MVVNVVNFCVMNCNHQYSSYFSKSITHSLKSKIRDLSPSRRATLPNAKPERKGSKAGDKVRKSPVSTCFFVLCYLTCFILL